MVGVTTSSAPEGAPPRGGPPPWINTDIQRRVAWRDGDIVISVPSKSGTTWTMNIVHQLRRGGDPDFKDIYTEVPWIELVERPGQTPEELLARWEAMPQDARRAFKTHAAPPVLPYVAPGEGRPEVRYIVVARDPEEALVSFKPFLEKHTDEWYALWGVARPSLTAPSFAAFYDRVVEGMGLHEGLFRFVAGWWPLRRRENVLMLHFSELKRDPEGSIRRIAAFLGVSPAESRWPTILECCSFSWMKARQERFEVSTLTPVPVLKPGAMIRAGRLGAAREDGMTAELAARLRATGERVIEDRRALEWHYRGGPLPAC